MRKRVAPATRCGVALPWVVPLPSWPLSLSPQHQATPSVRSPQVCRAPATIDWNACPPVTATGVDELAVRPLPSWPFRFAPQHIAAPSASAQVWLFPAVKSVALDTPLTRIGTFVAAPADGSPICPRSLLPQQATAPPVVRAQVCCPPAVTPRRAVTRAASGGGFDGGCTGGG